MTVVYCTMIMRRQYVPQTRMLSLQDMAACVKVLHDIPSHLLFYNGGSDAGAR